MAEDKGTNDDKNVDGDQDDDSDDKDTGRAGGDASLKAELAQERKERQAVQAKLKKIEQQNQTDHEKALEKAREEAREATEKEILTKANARILRTEVRRIAAEKFADPSDPVNALDLSQFTVDDDGNVDEKAISKELDDLLKRKPHWAKGGQEQKRRPGSADQGARGTGSSSKTNMNDLIRAKARGEA